MTNSARTLASNKTLILIRETWNHMSLMSGFDPLFSQICECPGFCFQEFRVPTNGHMPSNSLFRRIANRVAPPRSVRRSKASSPFVQEKHEILSERVLKAATEIPDSIILLSAFENQYGDAFASAPSSVRRRIAACVHQPPAWYRLHWRDLSTLNGLQALICFTKEQQQFLNQNCDSPTIRINHGVRSDFFQPGTPQAYDGSRKRILFVGQWLRDFRTLSRSMDLLWQKLPEVQLDCVIPFGSRNDDDLYRLAKDPRVIWHAEVPPEKLLSLYQNASLLFLPLVDATANNAVVEALASGVPVISSDVGWMKDCLPDDCGELCRVGDAQHHAGTLLRWLPDENRLKESGVRARKFAVDQLDWKQIALSLMDQLLRVEHQNHSQWQTA